MPPSPLLVDNLNQNNENETETKWYEVHNWIPSRWDEYLLSTGSPHLNKAGTKLQVHPHFKQYGPLQKGFCREVFPNQKVHPYLGNYHVTKTELPQGYKNVRKPLEKELHNIRTHAYFYLLHYVWLITLLFLETKDIIKDIT